MFIYVISDGNGRVKVGVAADVQSRIRSLQTGSADRLTIEYSMSVKSSRSAYKIESLAHAALAECRANGEWFLCEANVAISSISEAAIEFAANEYGCTGLHGGEEVSICPKASRYVKEMCLKTGLPKTHIIDEAIIEYYGAILGYKSKPATQTAANRVRERILEALSRAGKDGVRLSYLKRAKGVTAGGAHVFDGEIGDLIKRNVICINRHGRGSMVKLTAEE